MRFLNGAVPVRSILYLALILIVFGWIKGFDIIDLHLWAPGSVFVLLARGWQSACTSWTPISPYSEAYSALVCGSEITNPHWRKLAIETGLIHLFVVSGSHLNSIRDVLQSTCRMLGFKTTYTTEIITFLLLAAYTGLCGLQPPVFRALIQFGVSQLARKLSLFWRPDQSVLYSGIIVLLMFPNWISSISLVLSWLCALCLVASSSLCGRSRLTEVFVYLGLAPAIMSFGLPGGASILFNICLGPVLGFLLFPLSALCFLLPGLTSAIDHLWRIQFFLLALSSNLPYQVQDYSQANDALLWVYLLTLHLLLRHFAQSKNLEKVQAPGAGD